MKKFDLVYENLLNKINENEYIDSTFEDNLRLLVKMLRDNDYLPKEKDVEVSVRGLLDQPKNVKELILDTQEKSLPAIKLHAKQDSESDSFSVTVINLEKPQEQKEFTNSMMETIFDDVNNYIKTIALQNIKPEAAVEELPQETNPANQQQGGGDSQLPKI